MGPRQAPAGPWGSAFSSSPPSWRGSWSCGAGTHAGWTHGSWQLGASSSSRPQQGASVGLGGLQQGSGGCSRAPEVVVGLGGLQRGSAAAGGPRPGALPALAGIRGRAGAALSRAVPQHQGAGQRLGPEKQPGSSQPGITSQRHLPEPKQKRKEDFSPSGAGRDPGCPKGELELRAPQGPDTPRALPGIFRPPPKLLLDPRRWWDGAAGAPRFVAGSGCPPPRAAGRGRGHRPVPGPPSSVPGRPSEPPGRLPSPGAGICI